MEKLAIVPARENLPRFEEYLRCLCEADPGCSGEWKEVVTACSLCMLGDYTIPSGMIGVPVRMRG